MLTVSPLLLLLPLILATTLCLIARRVNAGNVLAQEFEGRNPVSVRRWDLALDMMMLLVVATFILFIDDGDVRSTEVFIGGLFYLSILAVALASIGYLWSRAWPSVLLRKTAFRAIMCLALFTMVLGLKAAGIGDSERLEDLARLNELRP